jgi:hypothetical protein
VGVDIRKYTHRLATRQLLVRIAVAAWVVVCVTVGAFQLASHLLTLPAPVTADPALRDAIATHRRPDQRGHWLVLHVILDDCKCSQQVLDHLLSSPRPFGVAERVVLISEQPSAMAASITAHGFDLDVVSPDELVAKYHVEVAPLLVIADPGDNVRYVGGYTPRKQAADVRDLAVITAIRRGEAVEPLPTFGCAVGRALTDQVDPLGIR